MLCSHWRQKTGNTTGDNSKSNVSYGTLFIVVTDHKPLVNLYNNPQNKDMQEWNTIISNYKEFLPESMQPDVINLAHKGTKPQPRWNNTYKLESGFLK